MSLPILLNQQLINIPLSWNELTLAQYTRMYNAPTDCNGYLEPIAALLTIDKHLLESLPEEKLTGIVLKNLLWLNALPDNLSAKHCPAYLQIADDLHPVPQSFEHLKFGQVLLFQSVLSEHTDKQTGALNPKAYAKLLAIVFSAEDDEPMSDKRVDALEAQLQHTPLTEAMPVLNFFLSCWQHLNNANIPPLAAKAPPKKSRQALSVLKNSGLTRWYAWLCKPKTLRTTKP
jgi:hypothetical protein